MLTDPYRPIRKAVAAMPFTFTAAKLRSILSAQA